MKKIFLFLFVVSLFAYHAKAQVVIGTTEDPKKEAILELRSDTLGLLLPRVTLNSADEHIPATGDHVEGMVVFNKVEAGQALPQGIYYNTGTQWVNVGTSGGSNGWIYMPSIPLDVTESGDTVTVDLYNEFYKQFHPDVDAGEPAMVKMEGAPDIMPAMPSVNDYWFYVIGYDASVFTGVSIDASGILSYTVDGAATDATFMNIVMLGK